MLTNLGEHLSMLAWILTRTTQKCVGAEALVGNGMFSQQAAPQKVQTRYRLRTSFTRLHTRSGSRRLLPGGQGTQGADGHRVGGAIPAHVFEGHRQRAVLVQQVVRHHHRQGCGHAEVGHETNEQRGHDAHGNGSLGVLHLFSWRARTSYPEVSGWGDAAGCEWHVQVFPSHLWWRCSQSRWRRKNRWRHRKRPPTSRKAWIRPRQGAPPRVARGRSHWKRTERSVCCTHQRILPFILLVFTHFTLELPVAFRISSGFKLQFLRFPFTKPEMMTNTSTTTLMLVKTLFTQADSFTPNASRPAKLEGK